MKFIFFPSHPAVLPLLTHAGLGAHLPSCFCGKGHSGIPQGSLAELQRWGRGGGWLGQGWLQTTGAQPQGRRSWFCCLYKSLCANGFGGGGQDERRPEEEQEQGQAGVNKLCWTQPQLDNLYDSNSKVLGSGRWPGWKWRERKVSGGKGQVPGMRHRSGKSQGHCLVFPWRWAL